MAKSLNQAFIKAYSKERVAVRKKAARLAAEEAKAELEKAEQEKAAQQQVAAVKAQAETPAPQVKATPEKPAVRTEPLTASKASVRKPDRTRTVIKQPHMLQAKRQLKTPKPEATQASAAKATASQRTPVTQRTPTASQRTEKKPAAAKKLAKPNPFILRVDTATIKVPASHLGSQNGAKSPLPANAGGVPVRTASVAQGPTPPDFSVNSFDANGNFPGLAEPGFAETGAVDAPVKASPQGSSTRSLTARLASDAPVAGIRPGIWEEQQIDAFGGGFPQDRPDSPDVVKPVLDESASTPSLPETQPTPAPNEVPASTEVTDSVGSSGALESTHSEEPIPAAKMQPLAKEQPAVALAPAAATAAVASSTVAENNPADVEPADVEKHTENARGSDGGKDLHHDPLPQDLETPESPALTSTATPKLTFEQVEAAVRELAEERKRAGEIFRLDKPSYSAPSSAEPEELVAEESGEDVSEESFSDTRTQEHIDKNGFLSKTRITRAMEEGLRNARTRVFNPVWEVDNLQWPEVCGELLDSGQDGMQRVAANLSVACQEGLQVLAVTSPESGAGRTTVACCLAMLAGTHGLKVAIVDGDIENPTLSLQTNLDVESDWKSALLSQQPLEEVAVHSIDDQVTLLPLLRPIDQSEMATDDSRIAVMLEELAESFDLVIVDTGHMHSTRSLVTSLGEQGIISAVVTVVDKRNSSPHSVETCIQRIRGTGIASIGLVENFAA